MGWLVHLFVFGFLDSCRFSPALAMFVLFVLLPVSLS